jgi:hypothetical protein
MNVLLWVLAHKAELGELLLLVGAVVSSIIGMMPSSASKSKAVAILGRLSALTHKDAPGTFKMPGAEMPKEADLGTIRLDAEQLARVEAMIANPPAPTEALREAMKDGAK